MISSIALTDFGKMQLKIIMAGAGMGSLTKKVTEEYFQKAGLWPMDYRFLDSVQEKLSQLRNQHGH